MTHLLSKTMLAGFAVALLAQPAAAAATCLREHDIVDSTPNKDGSAITFKMRDGKTYRNDLQGRCSDLKFNGFAWTIRGPEGVCDNEETIRVLQSGQICQLGKFTEVTPAPHAAPKG